MYKNIVRYHTFGEPVIIGAKPKEEKSEEFPENMPEDKPEPKPEPKRGIPQEILDKVFAEIAEIERKEKLTEKTLLEAQENRQRAEKIKELAQKNADELKIQAQEIKNAAEIEAKEIKSQAEDLKAQAEDLKKQAKKILDTAHKDAEKIVEDTRKEAEQLLEKVQKEGYDEGYDEGKQQGIDDGKKKIQDDMDDVIKEVNAKAEKTLQDAQELTSEYFIRAEDDIAKIVMMAIEKILPQHFLDVPQVILPVVREAINHVRDQKQIKVHVEPYSYDLVLMARSEFQSMLSDGTAIIEIVSDDALKPGDCVIETPNGGVDARLSTQIALMKNSIQNVLNN